MKEKNKTAFRKAIGLLMCLVVLVSMLPAVAEAAAVTTTTAIDTNKQGSITIHKYEYNGSTADPSPTPIAGNGEENQQVPAGAVALEGAGFTIYKTNLNVETLYSGINPTPGALPSAEDYYSYNTTTKVYTVTNATQQGTEQKTNASGVASFADLPVGVYLVIETTTPDKVTTPVEPFLVSIPMTKADGSAWMYDVHVYPKNKTTYGGVKLKKTGTIGNSTTSSALAGVTFVLQKKKEDGKYETVTTNDKGVAVGSNGTLTTDTDGSITVEDLSPGDYRFIETGIGSNYGYILDGATAYEFTIESSGDIAYPTTTPTKTEGAGEAAETYIAIDNKKPDVTKQVMNNALTPTPVKEADYSVGDTISYQVTINVPSNVGKLRIFEVKDTPNHIKYTNGTLKVFKADGSTQINANTYTLTENTPTNGFTVSFNTANADGIATCAGQNIIIKYDGVLQTDAVTTAGGNSNTVDLIYDNKILPGDNSDGNPNPTPMVTPPPSDTHEIEDSATVYTFKMTLNKTGDSNAALAGVKFDLYKEDDDGTVTGTAATAVGLDGSKKWTKIETLTTGTDGTVQTTKGLANGTYYLVETETNEGYNLLSKPVKVELKAVYTTSFKQTSTGESKTIKNEISVADSTLTEKMSVDNGTDQNSLTVNIKNSKGFTLPTTGGAGGFIFTLIGCIIMIVGIFIFRNTRKKTA